MRVNQQTPLDKLKALIRAAERAWVALLWVCVFAREVVSWA